MDGETSFPDLVATITPGLLESALDPFAARRIAQSAFNFEPELVRLDDDYSVLNLCNGPTGFHNDFGIAFLAATIEEITKNSGQTFVLAAVHSTTAASMTKAFGSRKGITAVLVYPEGPVYGFENRDLVSNGGNIIPIQVSGTFDDCQKLIAQAICDNRFSGHSITSANTINPGRLLPQVFYYLYAFVKAKRQLSGDLAFSVPCGNFGNLMAGLYAWEFGLPANIFFAAMNSNNALGDFFKAGSFSPKQLNHTGSPALDVRIPSNLSRLESFYSSNPAVMRNMVHPAAVGDDLMLQTIEKVWKKYGLHIDAHAAVAFAAAEIADSGHKWKGHNHTVVLSTMHYAKDPDLTYRATGKKVEMPQRFKDICKTAEPALVIPAQFDAFASVITSALATSA
jgi:threonine synthase